MKMIFLKTLFAFLNVSWAAHASIQPILPNQESFAEIDVYFNRSTTYSPRIANHLNQIASKKLMSALNKQTAPKCQSQNSIRFGLDQSLGNASFESEIITAELSGCLSRASLDEVLEILLSKSFQLAIVPGIYDYSENDDKTLICHQTSLFPIGKSNYCFEQKVLSQDNQLIILQRHLSNRGDPEARIFYRDTWTVLSEGSSGRVQFKTFSIGRGPNIPFHGLAINELKRKQQKALDVLQDRINKENIQSLGFSTIIRPFFRKSLPDQWTLPSISEKLIDRLLLTQNLKNSVPYFKGEWPTKILSTLFPSIIGVGNAFKYEEEATLFTTASIINNLKTLQKDHADKMSLKTQSNIEKSIAAALPTFARYQEGDLYNFYPAKYIGSIKTRRPVSMSLLPIWHGFTNIPEDADSTSVAYLALKGTDGSRQFEQLASIALSQIETYRDFQRKGNFYNRMNQDKNTGAYLTWLVDENDPRLPQNIFARPEKGARIPFNVNDVDCIVNINVLKLKNALQMPVKDDPACHWLQKIVKNEQHHSCGIYYPNSLQFSAALGQLESSGGQCLIKNQKELLVDWILKQQTTDGSFLNSHNIWPDTNLTTIYALSALMNLGSKSDARVYSAVAYGVAYLLSQGSLNLEKQIEWDTNFYFTATALARSLIMWKSDAYTYSLLADVFLKASDWFPNAKVLNYRTLNFDQRKDLK